MNMNRMPIYPDRRLHGVSPETVIAAIYAERGILLHTAKRLNVRRTHLWIHIKNRPALMKALEDAREAFLDTCEGKVYDAVEAGDLGSAKYVLSTRGKQRGWGLGNSVDLPLGDATALRVTSIIIKAWPSGVPCDEDKAVVIYNSPDDPPPDDEGDGEGDLIIDGEAHETPAPDPEDTRAMRQLRRQVGLL